MLLLLAYVVLCYIAINKFIPWKKITNTSDKAFAAFVGASVAAIIYTFFYGMIVSHSSSVQEYAEYDKVEIVALENASSLQGSFFLASGYIESVPHYVFYYKIPKGGKMLGKLRAEHAIIYEENRTDGYMAKLQERKVHPALQSWAWLLIPEFMQDRFWHNRDNYAIHVPQGTIKAGFNLNLKDLK